MAEATNLLGNTKATKAPAATTADDDVKPPEAKPPEKAQTTASLPKKYEVLKDFEVPRGASSYLLRQGSVLSSQGHDIAALMKIGVRLKEVT